MDPLQTLLRRVQRRMALQQWLEATVTALLVAGVASCVWLLATRLAPQLGDALGAALTLAVVALAGATGWAVWHRPSRLKAALEADKRFGLNERLTSSLQLAGQEGPMVEAVHEDARRRVRDIDYRPFFGIGLRRRSAFVLVPPMVFALAYILLPQWNLFGGEPESAEVQAMQQDFAMRVERVEKDLKSLEEKTKAEDTLATDVSQALDKMAKEFEAGEINERQALARLSNLNEDLDQHRKALEKKSAKPKIMADSKELNSMQAVADAIKNGEIGQAKKKLEEMRKQLEKGELSEQEKQALQKDLQELSEMLKSDQSEAGQALAEAMGNAAQAMEAGNMAEAMEGMEMGEAQLAGLEAMLGELEAIEGVSESMGQWESDLLAQCEGQGWGKGQGRGGGMGSGLGGYGRGTGNRVGELPDSEVGFQPTKEKSPMTKGKMLATVLQKTAPEEGEESQAELVQGAFTAVKQEAENALNQEQIPASARQYVRDYFGSLEPEDDQ